MLRLGRFVAIALMFAAVLFFSDIYADADDIIITMTSTSNVLDLEITEPTGERCTVWNPETVIGGELIDGAQYRLADAMDGYYYIEIRGPEEPDGDDWAQVTILVYEGQSNETLYTPGGTFRITRELTRVAALKMPEGTLDDWGIDSDAESGCFIATAAYGTLMRGNIRALSGFRDRMLIKSSIGSIMTDAYYKLSPPVAEIIRERSFLRSAARFHLAPFIRLAKLLDGL